MQYYHMPVLTLHLNFVSILQIYGRRENNDKIGGNPDLLL